MQSVSIPTATCPAKSSVTVSLGIPGAKIIAIYGQFKWSSAYPGVWQTASSNNRVLYYQSGDYLESTSTTITTSGDEFTMAINSNFTFSIINGVVVYESEE